MFVYITKLILAKIFDEKETLPQTAYRFQRLGSAQETESAIALFERMNALYKEAEGAYLALPSPTQGPAFDQNRISSEKIAFVVGRLESLSIAENFQDADLLGEFFEHIVSEGFTQTKGQFFTPTKVVKFMLQLADVSGDAADTMQHRRDHLGRPRLPYVIDPSCGSGTFLIEYMNAIRTEVGSDSVRSRLPDRIKESHRAWFSGAAGNSWAREFLFGIEPNYDLALAARVNMVLHGDGSTNTWSRNALLPFERYWIDERHNLLGIGNHNDDSAYPAQVNEQFDLILSNPPFSITLSADEKQDVRRAFSQLAASISEAIFVERWYQLLRVGGKFCCILPEAIVDTSTNEHVRRFIIQHFNLEAIVFLPYDAFKPFTSTKTCIVLATKRSAHDVAEFTRVWGETRHSLGTSDVHELLRETVLALGWNDETIFMAEPESIGYKRRKNLPDLVLRNDLYPEYPAIDRDPETVLEYWRSEEFSPHPRLGFKTTLGAAVSRPGARLDPKYRWLWDYQYGVALGNAKSSVEISEFLEIVDLAKVAKGDLATETIVIDLDAVESRFAFMKGEAPTLLLINSDKISFAGCEIAMSKLEPYLAKLMVNPPSDAIGSTEWFGLRRRTPDLPLLLVSYLLMLPELTECYRRLQSGKRHARMAPEEMLKLRVQLPKNPEDLESQVRDRRAQIEQLRQSEMEVRASIDALFELSITSPSPEPNSAASRDSNS